MGNDGHVTNFHVGPVGKGFPDSMMLVEYVQHEKGKPESSGEFLVFPTALGDKTYLNVLHGKAKQGRFAEDKGWNAETVDFYSFIRYDVDDNKLVVWWPLIEQAKRQAVREGKIKGVIEMGTPTRFTDTTENVARFVERERSVFPAEPSRLDRVGSGVRRIEQQPPDGETPGAKWPSVPTPPLRPLGSNLVVDKNSIIWEGNHPVGIWGVNGGEIGREQSGVRRKPKQ